MSSARGDRYYGGGVGGGEVDKEDYSTRTFCICICCIYIYIGTLNTMSLAVRLCIYTIIIQAYIDILGTVYTRKIYRSLDDATPLVVIIIIIFYDPHNWHAVHTLCFWRHCVVLAITTVIFRVQTIILTNIILYINNIYVH